MRPRPSCSQALTAAATPSVHQQAASEPDRTEARAWPPESAPTPANQPSSTRHGRALTDQPASNSSDNLVERPEAADGSPLTEGSMSRAPAPTVTVSWTASDDPERYRRLLCLIFGRAEAAIRQAADRNDGDS